MMGIGKFAMIGAALSLGFSGPVQAATCVPSHEAEALFLVIAPDMLRQVGRACGPTLPANSMLRNSRSPFIARYEAEKSAAWPNAKEAIKKIAGSDADVMLATPEGTDAFMTLMSSMLSKEIKQKDCPMIDAILTQLAPLPPRNMASVIVTVARLAGSDKNGKASKLPICPLAAN